MVLTVKSHENMKKIFALLFAALCLSAVSCDKNLVPDGADTNSVRMSLTPEPGNIPVSGGGFEAVVIVHQGLNLNVDWTVSVDGDPAWVSVSTKDITTHFTGTYAGDDADVVQKGIDCTVAANLSGKKRSAVLRFTVANGASVTYTINQNAK